MKEIFIYKQKPQYKSGIVWTAHKIGHTNRQQHPNVTPRRK